MRIIKYSFFALIFLSTNVLSNDIKRTPNIIYYHNVYEKSTGIAYQCSPEERYSEKVASYAISHLSGNLDYSNIIQSFNGSPIYLAIENKKTSIFEYPILDTNYFKFRDREKDDSFEFICIMKNDAISTCVNESNSIQSIDSKDLTYKSLKEGSVIINIASNFKINSFSFNFDTEQIDYTLRERKPNEKSDNYTILRMPYGYKKNFIIYEE